MKQIEISEEELELMNYNDIAHIILENNGKKMKITDLFSDVSAMLKLDENLYQDYIGDFFELLSTDKRFIMLDDGFWDLRIKHHKGMESFDEEEEEEEIIIEDDDDDSSSDVMYDDSSKSDDDMGEDDLSDLVIVDDIEDESEL